MFFFRSKKLIVDAFVSENYSHAYNYAPIDYTNKFYPDWWKSLPKTKFDFNSLDRIDESMKLCSGFLEHYEKGMVIPMWSDLAIKTGKETYTYQFSDRTSSCDHHQKSQRRGFWEDHMNIKIISPWLLKSEKDVSFTFAFPLYNHVKKPNFEMATGTVNFYYQHATHVNLLVKDDQEIFIPFRQPLLHIIPLTERKIEIRRHMVSMSEYELERTKGHQVSFVGSYHKVKKYRDSTEKSKCPFGFGK